MWSRKYFETYFASNIFNAGLVDAPKVSGGAVEEIETREAHEATNEGTYSMQAVAYGPGILWRLTDDKLVCFGFNPGSQAQQAGNATSNND